MFDNGSDVNEVVYNLNGDVVSGSFKIPGDERMLAGWYADTKYENKVEICENGLPPGKLTGDLDLYAKSKTFEIKGYSDDYNRKWNEFNYMIPESVTSVIFIDEVKPKSASAIDVDADGDGGVVAWTENNDTVMKVSTQIKGMKVQAAKDSGHMFFDRNKLANIDFSMFDTTNVTSMGYMFSGCSSLANLNLDLFNTANVTNMNYMFDRCSGLVSLDLTSLDMTNVMFTDYMFSGCKGLTSLDLTPLDTTNVNFMKYMFSGCSGLTNLDLTPLNTANVYNMEYMFLYCSSLTTIKTGTTFKFAGTNYWLEGTWQNTVGETFNGNNGTGNFPSNIADTYTKISS